MSKRTVTEPILSTSPTKMGTFLRHLFDDLNSKGIQYCVLRNYEALPDFTTHDVDLMVKLEAIDLTINTVLELAKTSGWRIIRLNERFQFLSVYLLWPEMKDNAERAVLKIDIWWGDTQWKAVPTISSEKVLQTARMFRGFKAASLGAEAAVVLAKEYLQFGKMGNKEKEFRNKELFHRAIESEPKLFVDTLELGFGKELATQMVEHIATSDWEWFDQQYRRIQLSVVIRSLRRRPLMQVFDWLYFLRAHFRDKVIFPSGLFVAFCGPDGSGKTTISKKLETEIVTSLSEIFPVVHHRHGRFGFIPDLKAIYNWFGRHLGLPERRKLSVENAVKMLDEPPFSVLRSSLYLAYYSIDYFLGHFMLLRARAAGHTVLFDRYYYDYLVHKTYERIPVSIRKAIFSFYPQPQLIIFLSGNAEVIHRRKPELVPKQIDTQQAIFAQIIHRTKNGHICESDSTLEETQMCVLNKLFDYLEQHSFKKLGKRL